MLTIVFLCLFGLNHSVAETENPAMVWDEDKVNEAASSQKWLRMLRYKRHWSQVTYVSLVDGPEFFFSPQGKYDPRAELIENLKVFTSPMESHLEIGKLKQHPQCAFPLRYRWLKEKFSLDIQDVDCPQLHEFISSFDAESVTLAFSSAYPNNPGSMFGHTFLRINSKKSHSGQNSALLDQGISFAAYVPPGDGGVIFAIRGVFGGYIGQFSKMPYYAKVAEYNFSHSRDLWEYDLNLSPAQTHTLLLNVWEIETNSYFDYYFFDENCSYHLLGLLEVARTDWDLTSYFIYMTPVGSVKKLTNTPGAVRQVHFRPSLRKRFLRQYSQLDSSKKQQVHHLLQHKLKVEDIADPLILETASEYLNYQRGQKDGDLTPQLSQLVFQIQKQRSQLGLFSLPDREYTLAEKSNQPELGHGSFRFGLAGGQSSSAANRSENFGEFNFRFAYHDLLANDLGYEPFSELGFPSFNFRYTESKKLHLESAQLVSVVSLFPLSLMEQRLSWKFELAYHRPKDLDRKSVV